MRMIRQMLSNAHLACDGEQQRRAEHVRELQACVIVAVPECWQLDQSGVWIATRAMALSENGVRHVRILGLVPTVRDHDSIGVMLNQIVLKTGTNGLYCCRVDGRTIEGPTDRLHVDLTNQLGSVLL